MDQTQQKLEPSGRDRKNSCYHGLEAKIDHESALAAQREAICDDRWIESQLEEPERWDGMS